MNDGNEAFFPALEYVRWGDDVPENWQVYWTGERFSHHYPPNPKRDYESDSMGYLGLTLNSSGHLKKCEAVWDKKTKKFIQNFKG